MHLFHSPWLRGTSSPRQDTHPRRAGTARRIALLLQIEAAKKAPSALEPAPQTCFFGDTAPAAEPIAA